MKLIDIFISAAFSDNDRSSKIRDFGLKGLIVKDKSLDYEENNYRTILNIVKFVSLMTVRNYQIKQKMLSARIFSFIFSMNKGFFGEVDPEESFFVFRFYGGVRFCGSFSYDFKRKKGASVRKAWT